MFKTLMTASALVFTLAAPVQAREVLDVADLVEIGRAHV